MANPYDGRKVDLCAFRGYRPAGDALLSPTLEGGGGEVVAGPLKVAQWFMIDFLTEKGSVPYAPTRGTTFVTSLRNGYLRTETDVYVAFGFAAGDLKAYAAAVEDPSAPADERFAGATLTGVTLDYGSAALGVTVQTRAGDSRAVLLPVSTF